MPDGGQLHIAARAVDLADDAALFEVPPGTYAMIEFADNGTGMDADTLARVFEPFFTTKRFGLGSGLGLSMAYGFAKQSGGGIAIQSQPGRGTTVLMALPLIRPEAGSADDDASELPSARVGDLVLLVEDDPAVRRVVRQQLVDLGYPVIEADNGAQALDLIEQVPDIAIVVSDVIMPGGISGRQLAAQVLARNPAMRVVLMSGYADEGDPVREDNLPVLAKPFVRRDLARAIAQAGEKTR
jgi:CheY-like chemotaxis protein